MGFYHRLRPHIIERHVYVQKGDKSLADLYKNFGVDIYILVHKSLETNSSPNINY